MEVTIVLDERCVSSQFSPSLNTKIDCQIAGRIGINGKVQFCKNIIQINQILNNEDKVITVDIDGKLQIINKDYIIKIITNISKTETED